MSVVTAPEVQTPEPLVEPDPVLMRAAEIVRKRGLCPDDSEGEDGSVCTIFAIGLASRAEGWPEATDGWRKLERSLGTEMLTEWNRRHTADEVAEAMERAAYGL